MNNTAIIYGRVSTKNQAKFGTSLEDKQLAEMQAYCERNNLNIVHTALEAFSGRKLNRPELNTARAMLRSGQAKHFVIYSTNRQDRSWGGANYLTFLRELHELGVHFHKVEQNREIDLNDSTQVLIEGIEGNRAGADLEYVVRNMHKGRMKLAQKGFVIGQAHTPYGYEKYFDETTRRYHWRINEAEAEIVRLIFNWYVFGDETGQPVTQGGIAKKLTAMGIETYADTRQKHIKLMPKGTWCESIIRRILLNETYVGVWTWASSKRKDYREVIDKDMPTDIKIPVPAIIDRDLFELAQQRKQQRNKTSNRKKYKYLLVGHLRCGDCGYAMIGASHKKPSGLTMYYRCKCQGCRSAKILRNCHNPHFRCDQTDGPVWGWVEGFIIDDARLLKGLKAYQSLQDANPLENELRLVRAQLAATEAEFKDTVENMRAVTSPKAKAIFAADLERIEAQQGGLEQRKAALEAEIGDTLLTDDQIESIRQFAANIRKHWDVIKDDYDSRRELLARLNIQVKLLVEDGQKVAKITGKLTAEEQTVCLDTTTTNTSSVYRHVYFAGTVVLG